MAELFDLLVDSKLRDDQDLADGVSILLAKTVAWAFGDGSWFVKLFLGQNQAIDGWIDAFFKGFKSCFVNCFVIYYDLFNLLMIWLVLIDG